MNVCNSSFISVWCLWSSPSADTMITKFGQRIYTIHALEWANDFSSACDRLRHMLLKKITKDNELHWYEETTNRKQYENNHLFVAAQITAILLAVLLSKCRPAVWFIIMVNIFLLSAFRGDIFNSFRTFDVFGTIDNGQHHFRQWFVCWKRQAYLTQWWFIMNWTFKNTFQ